MKRRIWESPRAGVVSGGVMVPTAALAVAGAGVTGVSWVLVGLGRRRSESLR